jgi:hypothetical protein
MLKLERKKLLRGEISEASIALPETLEHHLRERNFLFQSYLVKGNSFD